MIIGKMPFQVQRLEGYMIFIQIDLERRKRNNRKGNLPSLWVFFLKFTSLFLHFCRCCLTQYILYLPNIGRRSWRSNIKNDASLVSSWIIPRYWNWKWKKHKFFCSAHAFQLIFFVCKMYLLIKLPYRLYLWKN